MYFEFLVEEPSARIVLDHLLPRILGDHSFEIRVFNGKPDLLRKLPERLRAYRRWISEEHRIVILIDEDRQDCIQLKARLETAALEAGFVTKTAAKPDQKFQVLNRIAVEELEAWYFGDVNALCRAYPRVPISLTEQSSFRNSDAIKGGTAEALERLLKEKGYHPGGLEKLRAAQEIAPHMQPEANQSRSFQVFHEGLLKTLA